MENKIDELNELRMAEMKQAADLKSQYQKNNARLKDITEEITVKEQDYVKQMAELRYTYLNERHQRIELEKELKEIESQF
mmetsp:Transcript_2635/g.2275  ORF Transcript_2635/g.2275 Transcript_2635/m.2275 type:complete len:80 (-) Transcript_2635:1012-1251(-)